MKVDLPESTALVIFGATGDLAKRKLLPALYHLFHEEMLPARFAVVGVSRKEMSDDAFRDLAREAVLEHGRCEVDETWDRFSPVLTYRAADAAEPGSFATLREHLEEIDETRGIEGVRLFYCSTPPSTYRDIVRRLDEEGLNRNASIVIEKPYGTDLEDMRELDREVHEVFDEARVFRIDHYLGKESVQNVLAFRFANAFYEPVWNHRYVDHVQLTVSEEIGIEGRASFYEGTGALKDMVQTHLFQVLTFLAMEPPATFDPERLRDEKVKVLRAMRPVRPQDVVRGQYEGYRDESGVDHASETETFVAMRVEIDNWRWAGVPFFLRTGKRLERKQAEATIVFKEVPHLLFERAGLGPVEPNRLSIRFQPDEGLSLSFTVQKPGLGLELEPASMDFDYGTAFDTPLVEAYELLLVEAMRGDPTLFTRSEGVERAWEVLGPVIEDPPPIHPYEAGSWGPQAADELIAPRRWWMCPKGATPRP